MTSLILFSAIMGWCGTPWPGWWWWRIIKKPPPPPPPDWFRGYLNSDPMPGIILGIIGGIAGGLVMNRVVGEEQMAAVGLAAFAGGRVLCDIGRLAFGNKS